MHSPLQTSAVRRKSGFLLVAALSLLPAWAQPKSAQSGAPPLGSGPIDFRGFVRVIDGDTIEIWAKGRQIGVGLIGVKAPQGNNDCGKQTASLLKSLLAGGVYLVEDDKIDFDSRKRRMFYPVARDGRSITKELVKAGLADADGTGKEKDDLDGLGKEASKAGGKCVDKSKASVSNVPERTGPPRDRWLSPRSVLEEASPSAAASPNASSLASGFGQSVVANGLTNPTAFTWLPDGRILFAEKHGVVRIYKNNVLLPAPVIDISAKVNDYWDHGLIGITVDPNFATNGFIYLLYTYENDANQYNGSKTARLSRFTMAGDTAAAASEAVILGTLVGSSCNSFPVGSDCLSSENPSHSVGSVKFDSAGNLFVSAGDGASFNVVDDDALRAQNIDTLAGKILHVTPTGAGLPANPFWNGTATANRSKVWAYGLRNPYRINMRPGTNIPYLGDVGWSTWEEFNVAAAGANLGWPCYEGALQQPGYAPKTVCQSLYSAGASAVQMPIYTYNHNGGGAAATGGAFYTGNLYPAQYQGAYFVADYAQSWIRYLQVDANGNLTGGPFDFIYNADGPTDVEMGPDGNLYYISILAGELRRITFLGTDTTAPTITSRSPAAGSSAINIHSSVTATFSELVDPATVTGATFTLTLQSSGAAVSGGVAYEGPSQTATFTPANDLIPGATYIAKLTGGVSGVKDLAGNPLAADSTWTFTTVSLPSPPAGTSFVSALTPTSSSNGWGPVEMDASNGEQLAGDGHQLSIRTVKFTKGLGMHGPADIRYNLGATCSSFSASIGIDDEVAPNGAVVFQVWGDAVKLYESGTLTGTMAAVPINVNVTGKTQLQLVIADSGSGFANAHADWANAQVTCGTAAGPVVTSVTPADLATNVAAQTTMTAVFSKAINATTLTTSTFTVVKQGTSINIAATVSYNASTLTATLQPSAALAAGATYVATVKGGASGVKDTSGNPLAIDKVWSFTTSATAGGGTFFLSDLTPASSSNGWGPVEKDLSNGEQLAGDGHQISIRTVKFTKGLGMHAPADIKYSIGGTCTTFAASVGIDDEVTTGGSVNFQVWGDGVKLYDSGLVTVAMAAVPVSVNISGKSQLELVVTDGGNGASNDHADWGNAQITCSGTGGTPVATITSPSSSLLWKVGDVINFAGSAVDSSGTAIPASGLAWQIVLQHCPGGVCHQHPFSTATGATGSFTTPDHGDDAYFQITLTATAGNGATASATTTIQPQTVNLTLNTVPSGLQLVYVDQTVTTPFTKAAIVGSSRTLTAISPQGIRTFASWSDGGAAQHNVVIGTANVTYTATYTTPAPVISAVQAGNITSSGATITWTTDQTADTQVEYGLTTSYGSSTTLNATLVTSHSQALTGLTASTLYHFRVKSKNSGGVLATSADFTFTTATVSTTAPTVTAVSPVASATAVALQAPVTATFSKAINAATLTTSTFTLVKQGTTTVLAGAVTYNATTFVAKLQPTAPLLPNTVYVATVKGGALGVKDTGGQALAADFTWSFTTRQGPPSGTSFVSDLTPTSSTNGWGPVEKDKSNGEQLAGDGRQISIRRVLFTKGLGTHAASDVRYNVAGACTTFSATVGIDDEVAPSGTVVFQVWGDGVKLYDSGVVRGTAAGVPVSVTITGKAQLQLVVTNSGDNSSNDHADWANAQVTCQ